MLVVIGVCPCQVGCDDKQVCASDTESGTIDSSEVLDRMLACTHTCSLTRTQERTQVPITDLYGTCGGTGWCDGVANSGNTDCPTYMPYGVLPPYSQSPRIVPGNIARPTETHPHGHPGGPTTTRVRARALKHGTTER